LIINQIFYTRNLKSDFKDVILIYLNIHIFKHVLCIWTNSRLCDLFLTTRLFSIFPISSCYLRNCYCNISRRRLGSLVLPTYGIWLPEAAPNKSLDRMSSARNCSREIYRILSNENRLRIVSKYLTICENFGIFHLLLVLILILVNFFYLSRIFLLRAIIIKGSHWC